jgi:hypothetical protein
MKKVLLALVSAAVMVWVGVAVADYNVIDQGSYYKNAQSGAKVDAQGNAYTSEASKDRDNWRVITLINNQLGASGLAMIDSVTVPVPTYDFSRMNLYLRGNFDSLSTEVRLAVQVRAHYSQATDTASTFPWFRWPVRSSTVASDVDSTGHMSKGSYTLAQQTAATSANAGVWSGEFIVKFSAARADTTGGNGGGKYGANPVNSMMIPLCDANGAWFNAPYTSIRIRVINGVRSRFRVRADLVGVSK